MTSKVSLHQFSEDSQKEGFCLLYSGMEGETIVGVDGKRVDKDEIRQSRFQGTSIGYFAYPNPTLKNDIPDSRFYEFEDILIHSDVINRVPTNVPKYQTSGTLQVSVTKSEYIQKIKHIKELLAAGEIYQMCYSIRFRKKFTGNPYGLFLKLSESNPSNFSSYLNCGDFQIISASPERLFEVKNGVIKTQPIKGTVAKDTGQRTQDTDKAESCAAERLLSSKKDRAELDMITDLERNDVGKICEYGTLQLTKERELMELKNLWHTFSEVQGTLRKDVGPSEVIEAMFPGGSITGCPKTRAMKYIEELEGLPRNIFTGSVGYISGSKMDFNIAIRTALVKDGYIEYWAGGGIVADSDPESEYEECMLKAEKFLELV